MSVISTIISVLRRYEWLYFFDLQLGLFTISSISSSCIEINMHKNEKFINIYSVQHMVP